MEKYLMTGAIQVFRASRVVPTALLVLLGFGFVFISSTAGCGNGVDLDQAPEKVEERRQEYGQQTQREMDGTSFE